ncbi:hypothetical protein ATC00_05550 [Sinorhizobium americanum]|nr:hypothetical protein ATC00_05550 [Sinorhizobium americanum]
MLRPGQAAVRRAGRNHERDDQQREDDAAAQIMPLPILQVEDLSSCAGAHERFGAMSNTPAGPP